MKNYIPVLMKLYKREIKTNFDKLFKIIIYFNIIAEIAFVYLIFNNFYNLD